MSRPLEFDALEEPACPRCAALTRERDVLEETLFGDVAGRLGEALDERAADVLMCLGVAERDLAQARQALHHVLDEAIDNWHGCAPDGFPLHEWLGLTPDEYAAFVECRMDDLCALVAAREALVERGTEQDLGGEQGSPCEGEQA